MSDIKTDLQSLTPFERHRRRLCNHPKCDNRASHYYRDDGFGDYLICPAHYEELTPTAKMLSTAFQDTPTPGDG